MAYRGPTNVLHNAATFLYNSSASVINSGISLYNQGIVEGKTGTEMMTEGVAAASEFVDKATVQDVVDIVTDVETYENLAGGAAAGGVFSKLKAPNFNKTPSVDLRLPSTMAAELSAYQTAAAEGNLIRISTKGTRSSARRIWEAENGPVPDGFDVDHIIQRQFGGPDDISNLQLKKSGLNRSEGPKAYHLNKQYPYGTKFNKVKLDE